MNVEQAELIVDDEAPPPPPAKPSMAKVVCLLVVAAGVFSYLIAYAATDALASANIIRPLRHSPDPRPIIAGIAFGLLLFLFLGLGTLVRLWSWRHFRRLDQMIEAEK